MPTKAELERAKELVKRKQIYKETYRKGLFLTDKERLCDQIMQPEVIVRAVSSGSLDDDTEFINISVEGVVSTPGQKIAVFPREKLQPAYEQYCRTTKAEDQSAEGFYKLLLVQTKTST